MSKLHHFTPGDYQFLEGGFPYSQGVIASPDFELERVRFANAPGIGAGFERIAKHLHSIERPLTALCAIELRSAQPFTFSGFHDFNVGYVNTLTQWGLVRDGLNPVGRSNVCPVFDAPKAPVFHAFSYTVPATPVAARSLNSSSARDFIVAGSGEWPEGQPFPQAIIARGDLSSAGLAAKVAFVIKTMQERCAGLGGDWRRLSAAQIYTAENIHALQKSHFASAGLTAIGLSWHLCKPPIIELEFEMDVRSLACERVLYD
jgi:hypothetical protein